MIRPIQITLNAAHPELPLVEASTFVGSPSTAFVRGVPATVGSWSITAVRLVFAYPDNSVVTANCVNAASGVWVGTIAPTATSGRTANGYQVLADGIDENGDAVTGYVLGMGDLAVYTRDMTIDGAAGVKWYLHYFDTAPATPKKGDVAKVNGLICLYDGTAWVSFGDGPGFSTDAPAMDGTASAGVAETAARSDHRHPTDTTRASTADATLTPIYGGNGEKYSDWVCDPAQYEGRDLEVRLTTYLHPDYDVIQAWRFFFIGTDEFCSTAIYAVNGQGVPDDAATLAMTSITSGTLSATRAANPIIGYQLGSQTDKPLASEAEAEALRTGKQDALTAQQLANIAAVSDALAFDATHSYAAGDPVVYNGTLYTFTTAHTGAWTGSDVSAVDIIARLAGKLDKSGGTVTGNLAIGPNSNYSAKFESDPSGGVTLMLRDSIGNMLIICGGKLYYQQYDWQAGVELFFPSTDGTLALTAGTGHTGNLAALDASGNPTDAGWTAGDLARYALTTKTIDNGAVTLDDRAINAVAISSSLASLTVNFPTATSGKARDFGLRLTVASGITTAPELALPQGIVCENADGEAPEIGADGAATILYFTETASGVFLVKGEVLQTITA